MLCTARREECQVGNRRITWYAAEGCEVKVTVCAEARLKVEETAQVRRSLCHVRRAYVKRVPPTQPP